MFSYALGKNIKIIMRFYITFFWYGTAIIQFYYKKNNL